MARRRKPVSLPPDMIRFVPQNGLDGDCGVATIATLLGLTRDEAIARCAAEHPDVLEDGITYQHLVRVAARMGERVKWAQSYDIDEDTGILWVENRKDAHVVFLWAGRIIDGNGEHWLDPSDFLTHYGWTPGPLLVKA